jgi:hypothetical protein
MAGYQSPFLFFLFAIHLRCVVKPSKTQKKKKKKKKKKVHLAIAWARTGFIVDIFFLNYVLPLNLFVYDEAEISCTAPVLTEYSYEH